MDEKITAIKNEKKQIAQRGFERIVDALDMVDLKEEEVAEKILNLSRWRQKRMVDEKFQNVRYGAILRWLRSTNSCFYAYRHDLVSSRYCSRYYPDTVWIKHPFNDKIIIEIEYDSTFAGKLYPYIWIVEYRGLFKKKKMIDYRHDLEGTEAYVWFKRLHKHIIKTLKDVRDMQIVQKDLKVTQNFFKN